MLRISVLLLVATVSLSSMGCATVMRGTTQDISISSEPFGASVTIDHQPHGVTPIVASLSRESSHFVSIELEGYGPVTTRIISQHDGAVAGNCLLGGIPGIAIDSVSGAGKILQPEIIHVVLVPLDEGEPLPPRKTPLQPVQHPQVQVPRPQQPTMAEAIIEGAQAAVFGCIVLVAVFVMLDASK